MTKKQSLCIFRELHLTWGTMVRYLIQCSIPVTASSQTRGWRDGCAQPKRQRSLAVWLLTKHKETQFAPVPPSPAIVKGDPGGGQLIFLQVWQKKVQSKE